MARGRFITLEGGEGAGKSVQRERLVDTLRAAGLTVTATREPGGSPGAEAVRALLLSPEHAWQPLSEALLHAAARVEHLAATIRPALAAGQWVVADRFMDSTRAYQGWGQGVDLADIDRLEAMVVGDHRPDLTLVLDVPAEVGLARAHGRGQGADRYERMTDDVHIRLRDGYLAIARSEPERCAVIDATQPLETVAQAIVQQVRMRLGAPI